jgi:hypothetical protein
MGCEAVLDEPRVALPSRHFLAKQVEETDVGSTESQSAPILHGRESLTGGQRRCWLARLRARDVTLDFLSCRPEFL